MKIKIVVLLAVSLFLTGCFGINDNEEKTSKEEKELVVETISLDEVKEIVDNYPEYPNVDIVDVRSEEEYNSGHIEGSINIPLDYIEQINISTDRQIIVYCQSGSRSEQAAKILMELGYEDVKDMGAISDWDYDLVEE